MSRYKTTVITGLAALTSLGLLTASIGTMADIDPLKLARLDADEARELNQSGQIMSLESLIAQVRNEYPGHIIEIELDDDDDRYVYEIEIVDEEGVVIELKIDAADGEVLEYKKDY